MNTTEKLREEIQKVEVKLAEFDSDISTLQTSIEAKSTEIGECLLAGKSCTKVERGKARLFGKMTNFESAKQVAERRLAELRKSLADSIRNDAVIRMGEIDKSLQENFLAVDKFLDNAVESMGTLDQLLGAAWELNSRTGIPLIGSRILYFAGPVGVDRYEPILTNWLQVKVNRIRAAKMAGVFIAPKHEQPIRVMSSARVKTD